MTTFITGATGFVGSAVVRQLLEAGHTVRALARPGSDRRNLAGLSLEIVTGDLTDQASLQRALVGCRFLFHVAADYRLWVPRPEEMIRNNVEGTHNVMLAAARAGVERIVYTSSVATMGLRQDGVPANETTPVGLGDMIGPYKRTKFQAEALVRELVGSMGLPVVIVNPSTPIGPRDIKPTPTGRLIADAVAGRMPAYVDTGLNIVHVDDVAAGHLLALERGVIGERYILGGENFTLEALLRAIALQTGHPAPRLRLPHGVVLPIAYVIEWAARRRLIKDPRLTVDGVRLARKQMFFSSEKACRDLGYQPRPASEAIRDAVEWFQGLRVNEKGRAAVSGTFQGP